MKILIVRTYPDVLDITKYNVQEIGMAKALLRAGHEVGIVLYNGKERDCTEAIPILCDGIEKYIVIYHLHGFGLLKNGFFPSLKKIAKSYDVLQVHEYDQITSWLYYAWNKKKKIVLYHGPYYHSFNKGYNFKCKIFDLLFLKIKHNKNVTCLTKSHAAAEFLRSKGFRNVTAVGVGLDTDNFTSKNLSKDNAIKIDEKKFNLVYVGKIEERRNSMFLLDVIKQVTDNNPKVHCIIVGNGEKEYKEMFLRKAKSLISSNCLEYYESASQSQLADMYKKVQLMVFPSNYDIFGMVLLEAVYFGLPVISSPNGGADMLIESGINGEILSDFSTETWAQAILELVREREKCNKYKENNLKKKDKLTWDGIVEKCDVYRC